MLSHEQLIEFHSEARQIKEHHWHVHKEPDPPPMLVVRWRDMDPQAVDFMKVSAVIEGVHEWAEQNNKSHWLARLQMNTPFVLSSCLVALEEGVPIPGVQTMPPEGTPMESIWFAVEGYSIEGDDLDLAELENYQRGNLERDFKTNPASKVIERLTTYMVETSSTGLAEWARVTSAFHKEDGGKIVWHDPLIHTSEETQLGMGPDKGGIDRLLEIMTPHVTREKLA